MESEAELPAEIHPLKAEERPTEKRLLGGSPRTPGRLSRWRTAAFFLALFLCLTALLAFSFIIPCPVRPTSQRTWNRTYSNAVAYQFLATRDVNQDRVQDMLFAFRASSQRDNSSSSLNSSCVTEGFAPPCAFLVALSGTDSKTLWQQPVAEELLQVDCSMECSGSHCCLLVGRPGFVAALNLHTGKTLWKQTADLGANAKVLGPLLQAPDIDGDSVPDFLLFTALGQEIKSWFFSGKHGTQVGSPASLSLPWWVGHLLQVTATGAHYVLFCTASALYGYSVKELHYKATGTASASLTEDPLWKLTIDSLSHHVPLRSSGHLLYLEKTPGPSTNMLVVRSDSLELLDGKHLGSLWTSNTPNTLSKPAFGSFHSGTTDVVIESKVAPDRKKVLILKGSSADINWETQLPWTAGSPQAATLATVDHRSIFLLWGTDLNTTEPKGSQQRLHMFHPSLPTVLLETRNSIPEPIVAFQAVLLEQSRHPCYLLLTGPQAGELPGQVVLAKWKMKDALAGSRVIWLNKVVQDSAQNIRDHFLRMKYRSLG